MADAHTRSGRCSIFEMQTASDYLLRLARAARRVHGPRTAQTSAIFHPVRALLASGLPLSRAYSADTPTMALSSCTGDPS